MIPFQKIFVSNIFKFSTVLAFNQGLNFLLIFIYLKTIDISTYGMIGLVQSYAILIGVISMLGIRDGFYTLYYKVDKKSLYSNFFLFFIVVLIIFISISFFFKDFLLEFLSIPNEFYSLILIYAMSNSLYANLEITMRLENWNNLYLSISLLRGMIVFLAKFYCVLHIENSTNFIINILMIDIISFIVISIIVFILLNIKILKFKYHVDLSLYPRLFKVGLPFLASNGSGWIFNGFDRVLIERFFSLEILGIYLYGTRIAAAIGNIVHQILNLLYAPKALKLLSENKTLEMENLGDRISNLLIWLIFSAIVLTLFVYFSLDFFNILNYEMIAYFFLGAFLVEIAKIVPRINGQKILFLEKSQILSSLYIVGSVVIVVLYDLFLEYSGLGIIFLAQILVYSFISYLMHYYIIYKTSYKIVYINKIFWLFIYLLSIIILIYFWETIL
jgi:O-antigen/teichoic acid export membrane protein